MLGRYTTGPLTSGREFTMWVWLCQYGLSRPGAFSWMPGGNQGDIYTYVKERAIFHQAGLTHFIHYAILSAVLIKNPSLK